MTRLLLLRLSIAIISLVVISFAVFMFPYIADGDPVRAILRARTGQMVMDDAAVAALREAFGLDRPLHEQYLDWLRSAVLGDLGYSHATRLAVVTQIIPALSTSLVLIATSLATAVAISLPLSIYMAINRGRTSDTTLTVITQCFIAIPEYWIAPVFMLAFSLYLGLLPAAGWGEPANIVLPVAVLCLRPLAYFTHVTRASMIDVLESPYILAARARGLTLVGATIRHGIRNGIGPLVTLFGIWFGGLLAGAVLIEVIFAIPGMGRLIYSSVINRDTPLLQGSILVLVTIQILVNTMCDLIHALLNPGSAARHD
ncbi:ABC transporter permease [Devosia sp.]|uniref:ABC transporter permease n=1 Tax=Devosia sp. TaxID=1871048 RepID=UPI002930BB65|nr:ABC transporter permease [Devosia sp.]